MPDLICRKTMMRCQTPGMCSPHGGCSTGILKEASACHPPAIQPAEADGVERYDWTYDEMAESQDGNYVRHGDYDAVTAERDRLQAALSAPDTITAEPAGDYDNLRKQFLSLRMLANSNAKMVHHWRAQCDRETRETLLANAASVNAERDTNSMLTDVLETAERERDQLRAERDALRKDAERYRWICSASYGAPSHPFVVINDFDSDKASIDAAIDAAMQGEQP